MKLLEEEKEEAYEEFLPRKLFLFNVNTFKQTEDDHLLQVLNDMSNKKFFMQSYCSCYVFPFHISFSFSLLWNLSQNCTLIWSQNEIHLKCMHHNIYMKKRENSFVLIILHFTFIRFTVFFMYMEIAYLESILKYEIFCLCRVRVIQTYPALWH